jgi:hypothetical protein
MSTPLRPPSLPWRPSALLLLLSGLLVAGIGFYFLALRPPLLPEDLHFLELTEMALAAAAPRLPIWLTNVFRVLGGYALATGIVTISLAATSYRMHHALALAGAVAAGASGIGLMVLVNFAIASEFRWLLFAFALVWAASLVCFWIEARTPIPSHTPISERN